MKSYEPPIVPTDYTGSMDRRQFLRIAAGSALAASGLYGCGGGGGNGGGGGGTISDASRDAALKGVEDNLADLLGLGLSRDQVNQAMASFMAANPLFEETGVSDSLSAWGRFTDGRLVVVANSLDPEAVTNPDRSILGSSGRAGAELPSTAQARLMHSFGPSFDQLQRPVDDMAGYLRAHGYQIQPGTEGDARLGTLRQINNASAGFFYINSHGGKGKLKSGAETFVVGSSTLRTDPNLNIPEIKADWDNNRIAYLTAANGNPPGSGLPTTDTRLAIAPGFVQTHMSFAPGAVVYINACFSAKTDVPDGAFAFIKACHRKGAGVYIGWTGITSVNAGFDTARMFVDLMLGHNKRAPVHSPEQRPFDYEEVIKDLKTKHNLGREAFGSELVAEPNSQVVQPIVLTPSIEHMRVVEFEDKLVLHGLFGKDKPVVKIGGQEVDVLEWRPDRLIVKLDRTGTKSMGNVVVDSLGRLSNVRRITEWIIPINYTLRDASFTLQEGDPLRITGLIALRFRADVGEFREEAHGDIIQPIRTAAMTRDSGADLAATGPGIKRKVDDHCDSTWEGQGTYYPGGFGPADPIIVGRFKANTETKKGYIGLEFGGNPPGPFSLHTVCEAFTDPDGNLVPGSDNRYRLPLSFGLLHGQQTFEDPADPNGPAIPLFAINFDFEPSYRIPAGVFEDADLGMRLDWTAVNPSFPPNPQAQRSPRQ